MRELEEVNCAVRKVIGIQPSVLNRLNNSEQNDLSNGESENELYVPYGGFLNQVNYAWLSYACHLVVFNVKTGENVSSWTFRERVTCVCQFPSQPGDLPLLLVGLDNGAIRVRDSSGMLCVFNCATSRVLRAIKMPAGVEQVSVVSGGTEWEEFSEKRPGNILPDAEGIACVALRNLQHIVINLQRGSWASSSLSALMDESSPSQLDFNGTQDSSVRIQSGKEKHAAINLLNTRIERHIGFHREDFEANAFLEENLTTALMSSTKIGCLISGCLGRVIIWQNDGMVGWISPPVDEALMVTHLALLEPTDDPRPFYYLWVVFQDEAGKASPLLRMYALLFERKYCDRGINLYFNLEAEPSLKFELELDSAERVVSLSAIERESSIEQTDSGTKRGEDNLLLIATGDKTFLFDLNQWYKEQMPQGINECQNPNSILACYQTQSQAPATARNEVISCAYIPSTLREFPSNSSGSSEELYYPNSLSLEWVELSASRLTFWMSRGIQAELLRDMAIAGPIILTQPAETFHKCLSVGLVPFNTDVSFTDDHNVQRDMLLSLCLEQRWATFLVRCAKEWSDGSAAYLYPGFVKWGVQRASSIKVVADRLCVPLFDQSGNNIGESEVKTLRFCSQQLECLSNVVAKLPFETSDLVKQRRALRRVSTYLQVLLWFYDVGLLPESQEMEDGPLPIPLALRIPYPYARLYNMYKEKREQLRKHKADDGAEDLFIDELIMRECPVLKLQWEREAGDSTSNGYYPPSSLQSLLRSYLATSHQTETEEIECKHQITIYLLMDLAMLLLPGSYPGVEQLIKYPSAFKMSPSLIKLTQAFWHLDHGDYQEFLDTMTGQLVSDSDVKEWHHKLVLRTLVRKDQHKLALTYLHVRKPPLSSVGDQSTLIKLSVEHGLVQSAFHRRPQAHYAQLLVSFFQACKSFGKLSDILHLALNAEEEEIFMKFLEEEKSTDVRLLYYLQRCRYTEASNTTVSQSNPFLKESQAPPVQTMLNAYKATLPDVIKRFSLNMAKNNSDMDLESRYPRPMSHCKSWNKTLSVYENSVRKAQETYLRRDKAQIPFISAPCVSLKLSEAQSNTSCVHFPQLVNRIAKRTLDQVYEEEETTVRSPEGVKRRKLEERATPETSVKVPDKKESSFNVALSTPLVKRKSTIANSRDPHLDTPHSILKIRRMIRNSTSPSVGTSQCELPESPPSDKEKKMSRQIRFSIGQHRRSSSNEEVNGPAEEVSSTKMNVSVESEEVYSSPNATNESLTETAVLSDGSFCNVRDSPRPRPSLRRICLDTPKTLVDEPVNKFLKRVGVNTPGKSPSKRTVNASVLGSARKGTPRKEAVGNVSLSSTVYTPSILSDDSSSEMGIVPWKLKDDARGSQRIFAEEDTVDHKVAVCSTPRSKAYQKLAFNDVSVMNIVKEQVEPKVVGKDEEMDVEEENDSHSSLPYEEPALTLAEEEHCKYKNGCIAQTNESYDKESRHEGSNKDMETSGAGEVESDKEDGQEEEFESLSTVTESSVQFEKKDRFSWFQKKVETSVTKASLKTSVTAEQVYDITDDESAISEDEMVLAFEETNTSVDPPVLEEQVYDVSNITDDESNSGDRKKPEQEARSVNPQVEFDVPDEANDPHNTSTTSVRSELNEKRVTQSETKSTRGKINAEEFEQSTPKKNRVRRELDATSSNETPSKELQPTEIGSVRMTRSRRASSIAKDIPPSPSVNSPSKATEKRSTRRASSLAKELLNASVVGVDDRLRQRNSSGSEDSFSVTTKKSPGRRASSVAKEADRPNSEDAEARKPVTRSTRRAASVQKELPEAPKALTRGSRVSSMSSLVSEQDEEAIPETKGTRRKGVAAEAKKTRSRTTRVTKTQSVAEEEHEESEEPVKPVRRRGNSVPKDSVLETSRTRRSTSLAKDIEPEVNSPATKTRSHRLSIQSIPEELEEVLSMPAKNRSFAATKQESQAGTRQRRAVSMEPAVTERKKATRSVRGKGVLKEAIAEEDTDEVGGQEEPKVAAKKAPVRRTRKASETSLQDVDTRTTTTKPRRGRKPKATQDNSNQYSFSQPDETQDVPADEKNIGEIPGYIFSPPHTRSKQPRSATSDQHCDCCPIQSEEE